MEKIQSTKFKIVINIREVIEILCKLVELGKVEVRTAESAKCIVLTNVVGEICTC